MLKSGPLVEVEVLGVSEQWGMGRTPGEMPAIHFGAKKKRKVLHKVERCLVVVVA
jgi:hypothetical protein